MRRLACISAFIFALCTLQARSQIVFTKEVDATADWSSYGNPYFYGLVTFEAYIVDVNSQFTNHFLNTGSSGQTTGGQWQNLQEKRNLPWWNAAKGTNMDFVLANDNGSLSFSDTTNYTTQQFLAPPIFNNGTGPTNEGNLCSPVAHFAMGRIPANIAGGDSGSIVGNAASMSVATNFNTPPVDTWHLLYTNGLLTTDSDFFALGHPGDPGSVAMALLQIKALGFPTAIGSLTFDYATATAITNNFTAAGIVTNANSLRSTIRAICMPPGFDVPDGNLRTNDARKMFVEFSALGSMFTWTFAVTNLPAGNWTAFVDGTAVDTATAAQWAAGRNWFTNYAGPFWAQRLATLDAICDGCGVDHYTHQPTHNAGTDGVIPGVGDLINNNSHGDNFYDTDHQRGATYCTLMASSVSDLYQYDLAKHVTAIQTNHTFSIVNFVVGTVNVGTVNVGTLTIGP